MAAGTKRAMVDAATHLSLSFFTMKRAASSSDDAPSSKSVKSDRSFVVQTYANGRFGTKLGPEEWTFSWTDPALDPLAGLFRDPKLFFPDCDCEECGCASSIVSALVRDSDGECLTFKDGWYAPEPREFWVEEPICPSCMAKFSLVLKFESHGHQTEMVVPRELRIDPGKIPATKPDHVRDHEDEAFDAEIQAPAEEPEIPDLFKYTVKDDDAKVVGTMVIELDDCLDEHFVNLLCDLHTQQKDRAEFTENHQVAIDVLECIRTQSKEIGSEFVGPHLDNIGAELDKNGNVEGWGDFITNYVYRNDPFWMAKTLTSWEYDYVI